MINFSIIIPHYNIPEYLEKLLLSIPCEKDDVEVIVVDDRSDRELDRLREIRKKFSSTGIRFYRNNRGKKGAGTCRNIGIRHASGKWLIFADADDCFTSDFYDIVSGFKDSGADIIFFKSKSIDDKGEELPEDGRNEAICNKIDEYLKTSSERSELLLRYDMPIPWGKMIRKKTVDDHNIRFDEIPVSNDVMFSVKCAFYAGKIEASDEYLYYVRERGGSLTTTFDEEKFKLRTDVFVRMCRYLKSVLSRDEWRMLGFNGNIRLIEAYQRGYGIKCYWYIFRKLLINGIAPVSLNGMSIKSAPDTLKRIINEKQRRKA